MDDALSWIALRHVPGLRRREAARLLEAWGSPSAIFERSTRSILRDWGTELLPGIGVGPDLGAAKRELAAARRYGLEILMRGRPGFPQALQEIPDGPLVLYARGSLPAGPALAVVGSRRPSARALQLAGDLAAELAADGVVIVSGLAYGVDAAAHQGALRAGGRTVAVLAGGLDRARPIGNRRLAQRILDSGGAWLSEYAPGQEYRSFHFPERNRLISGLSRATLVVEARARSGTLWTAKHALEQGRNLGVVPGPVDSDLCRGSNRLLRYAVPILDAEDLRVLVGVTGGRRATRAGVGAPAATGDEGRVLAALRDGPRTADDLVRALDLPADRLAAVLLELELAGRIARDGARVVLRR